MMNLVEIGDVYNGDHHLIAITTADVSCIKEIKAQYDKIFSLAASAIKHKDFSAILKSDGDDSQTIIVNFELLNRIPFNHRLEHIPESDNNVDELRKIDFYAYLKATSFIYATVTKLDFPIHNPSTLTNT